MIFLLKKSVCTHLCDDRCVTNNWMFEYFLRKNHLVDVQWIAKEFYILIGTPNEKDKPLQMKPPAIEDCRRKVMRASVMNIIGHVMPVT